MLEGVQQKKSHSEQISQNGKGRMLEGCQQKSTVTQCDSSTIDIMSEIRSFYTDQDIINRRAKAIQNVIRNYNIFKRHNQRNTSNNFFITCECSMDCNCYTHAQKPRLPIHMCMRKGELEWFYYGQPFLPVFHVQWRCDICKSELNCGHMWNYEGYNP